MNLAKKYEKDNTLTLLLTDAEGKTVSEVKK